MTTTRVYLIKRARTLPSGKRSQTYYLKWAGSNGKPQFESVGNTDEITRKAAETARREKELAISGGAIRLDKPRVCTLEWFIAEYQQRRQRAETGRGFVRGAPKLNQATITEHVITLRYMQHHFGGSIRLASIDMPAAERWVEALAAGKLAGARKASKQAYTLNQQTIRKHIRNAKAVFAWACRFGFANVNPFRDFDGKPLPSDPNHYVDLADVEKIITATTDKGWRALFALCRLAGLRRGEAITLPWAGWQTDKHGDRHWAGVDWEKRRIHLVAEKTHMARVVPICPRLNEILSETFAAAPDGATSVCGLSENNLTRNAQDLIRAAGVKPWAKLYQAMRSSCENDWKSANVAEATYATWMGHSADVSRKHYVNPTDAEFDSITAPTTN
jgi:integrase